jgi:hypothetical protein
MKHTKNWAALAIGTYWLALRELSITLADVWQNAGRGRGT